MTQLIDADMRHQAKKSKHTKAWRHMILLMSWRQIGALALATHHSDSWSNQTKSGAVAYEPYYSTKHIAVRSIQQTEYRLFDVCGCVGDHWWVITDSGNGLSPVWGQVIIRTNAELLSIEPIDTNFSEIQIKDRNCLNAFENAVCKRPVILFGPCWRDWSW